MRTGSFGPRHLAPAIPFLCLGLAPLWSRGKVALRVAIAALALVGAAQSLAAVAVTAQPPVDFKRPMSQLVWPAFFAGDVAVNPQSIDERGADPRRLRQGTHHAAWNLGQLAGLPGLWSLAPLGVLLAGAGVWWGRRRG